MKDAATRRWSSVSLIGKGVIATGASACLVACGAPEGVDAASQLGGGASGNAGLTIACSQQEDFCQRMSSEFERATGISTTYVRLGAGEVLARLQANPGEFDVWSGGQAENHLIAHDKGWIEPYISPSAEALPEKYNDPEGVWSGFYTDSIAFCYNPDEIERTGARVPESWEDLLQPELKGKIVMAHPATAGVGYMVLYTLQQVYNGQEGAIDYMKKLNQNILQYSKSSATSTLMAGRGEIAVGIALDSDCAKAQQGGFSMLEYSYPKEGTGYEVGAVSVLKNAAHRDAAEKYMDWVLSADAQKLYESVPSYAAPTVPGVNPGEHVPDQSSVVTVEWDPAEASAQREELLGVFTNEVASADVAQ